MSKELLKALTDVLDDLKLRKNLSEDDALNISHSVLMRAEKAVKNYLAQPEQEPSVKLPSSEDEAVMMNILSDNWLRHHAPHRLNRKEPLSVDRLTQLYAINVFNDHFIFARQIEKAHGIGVDDE